jgi:ketosteroid isomerase-like protein
VYVGGSDPGTFRGLTEVGKTARERLNAFADVSVKAERYRELDNDRVLVFFSMSGRGELSGLDLGDLHRQYANVFHLRDGSVTRIVFYWDRETALAELGLAAEGDVA